MKAAFTLTAGVQNLQWGQVEAATMQCGLLIYFHVLDADEADVLGGQQACIPFETQSVHKGMSLYLLLYLGVFKTIFTPLNLIILLRSNCI